MSEFKNKTILITGGARGLGFGIASAFAHEGANLVLTDIIQDTLETAKKNLIEKYKIKVLTVKADGGNEAAVKSAIDQTIQEFGSLHVLVNNAQASKSGLPFIEHSKEDFDLAIYSGLYATFFYMKYAFPYLKESKGSIINMASSAGMYGRPGQTSYAAAKEGIRALSRVAATEWGEYGINVNIVCPLAMTEALAKWKQEYPDAYAENIKNIPMKRFADPQEDIGRVCVFLASSAANYISGETIAVQGGSGLRP